MDKIGFVLLLVTGFACRCFGEVELRVTPHDGLAFDDGKITLAAYRQGWTGKFKIKVNWNDVMAASPVLRFGIYDSSTNLFTGTESWELQSDGTVLGKISLECVSPVEAQCIALTASVATVPQSGLGDGIAQEYDLPAEKGRTIRLHFNSSVCFQSIDSRKWGGKWSVRFGSYRSLFRNAYAIGDKLEWDVTLSSSDGFMFRSISPCVVTNGDEWVNMDCGTDIKSGSALDFSGQGLQDPPAGKYGWLKAVGGHFEFEGLPKVEQRFYGVNLCNDANYLSHDCVDMLIARFVRCGYNAIRIHHHDGAWSASAANREKLDYLIARAIAAGLYITTDLYVSRPVKWREIGRNIDGLIGTDRYKHMIATDDRAFADWCRFARAFLEHINPYTGRKYGDEPAMPLISLINEGGESLSAWNKCFKFVRSLGAKALLTNDNHGRRHGEGEGLIARYDYVDNHLYVDHPVFLEDFWRLPSRCVNKNPIRIGQPSMFQLGWSKGASKPYTITEWSFSGPGRYRGMGGILMGALATEQEWDGVWRFAYSHSGRDIENGTGGMPGYFDCVNDPIAFASDRASVLLYLRRDAISGSLKMDKVSGSMSFISLPTCGGFAERGTVDAGPLTFTIVTNDTICRAVPTTLWMSSLDGNPLQKSSRMLLTHLTDVQGDGTRFADEERSILLNWGRGWLVESGAAEISLKVDGGHNYRVWALATDGEQRFAVPSRTENGVLRFTAVTHGIDGKGVIQYEVRR